MAGGRAGQEASVRRCGCQTLPTDLINTSSLSPLGGTQELWPSLHDSQGGTGAPWALVWHVPWGSVTPGPRFSEAERGTQARRHTAGSGALDRAQPPDPHVPNPLPEFHCP